MMPLRHLYAIVGGAMAALLASMLIDPIVPTFHAFVIRAIADPIVAYLAVVVLVVFVFDGSGRAGTEALFMLALVALFIVLVNEGLIALVGEGALSIEIAALSALSLKIHWGWIAIAVTGIASVMTGALLLSSLLLSIIIGGGIAAILGGQDA